MNSNDLPNRGIPVEDEANHVHGDGLPVDHENMLTVVPVTDEPIEVDDTFSLDKFQVVRREFFSHISEPSITFSNYKIGLNSACIKRLPQIEYIPSGRVLSQICTHSNGVPPVVANESRVR